jgi:hypothetical protein
MAATTTMSRRCEASNGETGHVASAEVTMSRGKITRYQPPEPDLAALQELQQQ